MAKIHGTFKDRSRQLMTIGNGDGTPPGIPPDLVWDPDNPQTVYGCSKYVEHSSSCDGTCETMPATENLVKLVNEAHAWARAQMSFFGVPFAYRGFLPVQGIEIELFDLEIKVRLLQTIIEDKLGFTREQLDDMFRGMKADRLREIREANEEEVKSQRLQAQLGVHRKPIFGPGGDIIK